jgi:hypothetical protein
VSFAAAVGGGLLAPVLPIPPATVSFHASAIVHPAGAVMDGAHAKTLAPLLPPVPHAEACMIAIEPRGEFVMYGADVSLLDMRHPGISRARVAVLTPSDKP